MLYWKATKTTTITKFNEHILGINKDNEVKYNWLKNLRFHNGVGMRLFRRSKLSMSQTTYMKVLIFGLRDIRPYQLGSYLKILGIN